MHATPHISPVSGAPCLQFKAAPQPPAETELTPGARAALAYGPFVASAPASPTPGRNAGGGGGGSRGLALSRLALEGCPALRSSAVRALLAASPGLACVRLSAPLIALPTGLVCVPVAAGASDGLPLAPAGEQARVWEIAPPASAREAAFIRALRVRAQREHAAARALQRRWRGWRAAPVTFMYCFRWLQILLRQGRFDYHRHATNIQVR
jgi:hypothetical protein